MRFLQLAARGAALLAAIGCADGRTVLEPTAPGPSVQGQVLATDERGARRVEAAGRFGAHVDFSTLTLTPRGRNCLLQVAGRLVFTGTIEGAATGRTSALVFASCEEVAATPPGTFADVFRSELDFDGTVGGEPARASVQYMGRVAPGGEIDGRLVLSRGVEGELDVRARVAVGGEYRGQIVVR